MDDGLNGGDSRDPAVEVVICPEIPPGQPQQQVIAHAEEPYEWEIGERYNAGPVRDVTPPLGENLRETASAVSQAGVLVRAHKKKSLEQTTRLTISSRGTRDSRGRRKRRS